MKETLRTVLTNTKMGERVCPPYNLCSLSGSIYDSRCKNSVIDGQFIGNKAALDAILILKPDILGITDSTPTHPTVIHMAEEVKKFDKKIIIVVGGKHPTLFPDAFQEEMPVDFIVAGEGEDAWNAIVSSSLKNRNNVEKMKQDLADNRGIYFRGKEFSGLTQPVDLNIIQNPDYRNLYPSLDVYLSKYPNLEVDVERARGCVGRCPFCVQGNSPQRKIRIKPAEEVFSEIDFFLRFGFKHIFFTDDDIAVYPESTLEICQRLIRDEKNNARFSANVRVDTLLMAISKYNILPILKQAGFKTLYIGLESGSEKIQQYNNKIITKEKLAQTIELLNHYQITTKLNLIIGTPYETKFTLSETNEYILWLRDHHYAFIPNIKYFLPYPGTKSYDDALRENLFNPELLELSSLESHQQAIIPTVGLTKHELDKYFTNFPNKFYTSDYLLFLQNKHPYLIKEISKINHSAGI